MALPGPITFGRYRLVEKLGSGGMAVVYRAEMSGPQGFSGTLVVKRILEKHSRDPAFVKMLAREARLSALLRHACIVQVYELGEVDGEHYITMELVDGWDLATILRQCIKQGRPFPAGLACFVVGELASALGYAHALRDADGRPLEIVHRDVSPSNVMISRSGEVKLLDFGISKAAEVAHDDLTRTGTLKGKVSYMSPEQADARAVDSRSDIFALGIVFWEALVTRRLFKGETDLHTLRLIRECTPCLPSQAAPWVDPEIDPVVMRMLARDPGQRFGRCEDVLHALSPIIHRLGADRAELRRFLAELKPPEPNAGPLTSADARPLDDSSLNPRGMDEEPPRTVTSSVGEMQGTVPSRARPRTRKRWLLGGALGVGALALLGLAPRLLVRARPARLPAAAAPAAQPALAKAPEPSPPEPAPALPATIHLRVSGPKGAIVRLDGARLGTVPLETTILRGEKVRRLTVASAGRAPFSRTITPDSDLSVSVPRTAAHPRPRKRADPEILNPFHRKK